MSTADERESMAHREEVGRLWDKALEGQSDRSLGFIANGGDSFQATVLATLVFEHFGVELDYLDVLQAESCSDLCALLDRERLRPGAG